MTVLITIFIFCIILIVYLHVRFHLKVNNDLDVFVVDDFKRQRINEICNLKQPFMFQYLNPELLTSMNFDFLLKNFKTNSLNVKKSNDTNYLPLKLENVFELFEKDLSNNYISEYNAGFLNDTSLIKHFKISNVLKPNLMSNSLFDCVLGKKNYGTELRHNLFYRNFFYVSSGKVRVKMFSPNNSHKISDGTQVEFCDFIHEETPYDDPEKNMESLNQVEKVLDTGDIIFIPPYWFYSFYFEESSIINRFSYGTYMSNVSILPVFCKHVLKLQNKKIKL